MTERDSGRYDAFTQSWVDQQIRIDFAWGNIPIQPNDDRGENTLDYNLDSHNIAIDGYAGYPAVNSGAENIEVPDVVGMLTGYAYFAVADLGLNYSVDGTQTVGATSQNDSHVYSQSPAPGTMVAAGTTVSVVIYEYVAPINHEISGIRKSFGGTNPGDQQYYMFLFGRNHNLVNGNTVNITGCDVEAYNKNGWIVLEAVDDDAFNTGGTKVTIYWNGAITETANGTGGTYAKV